MKGRDNMSNSYPEMELLENAIKSMKLDPSEESVRHIRPYTDWRSRGKTVRDKQGSERI